MSITPPSLKLPYLFSSPREGIPVRLTPELTRHVDAVLDDASVDADERGKLRFFTAFGADMFHAGGTGLRWGAVVGLPQTFSLAGAEELASSGFAVGESTTKFSLLVPSWRNRLKKVSANLVDYKLTMAF